MLFPSSRQYIFIGKFLLAVLFISLLPWQAFYRVNLGVPSAYAMSGGGTSDNPYQVASCSDFQSIQSNLSAFYVLMGDIDCSATSISDSNDPNYNASLYNSGSGLNPIGNYPSMFSGTFDGLGHTISNIAINRSGSSNVGPFGRISGTVKNVTFHNVTATGFLSVGGAVGYVDHGHVLNVMVNGGTISASHPLGFAGGAVGSLDQYSASYSGTPNLYKVSTDAITVNAASDFGGLVGNSFGSGYISDSYAHNVILHPYSTSAANLGALVGHAQADGSNGTKILRTYASGSITQGSGETLSNVGGLVGKYEGVANGFIQDSFAVTSLSGSTNVGAFIGQLTGSTTTTNNWFSSFIADGATCLGSGGLTGCNPIEAEDDTYLDWKNSSAIPPLGSWDFTNVWQTNMTDYPSFGSSAGPSLAINAPTSLQVGEDAVVTWDPSVDWGDATLCLYSYDSGSSAFADCALSGKDLVPPTSTGSHTLHITAEDTNGVKTTSVTFESAITVLNTCDDVIGIDNNLNASYYLMSDLDCSNGEFNPNDVMIGNSSTPFTGIFNGGKHRIKININMPDTQLVGLFSWTDAATITNLWVTGSVQGGNGTGGLAGEIYSTTVDRVLSSVKVLSDAYNVGGLIGRMFGNSAVSDVYFTGTVKTTGGNEFGNETGGIVGLLYDGGSIQKAYSLGTVEGEGTGIGGIAGGLLTISGSASISNSFSTSHITHGGSGGAIVGYTYNANSNLTFSNNYFDAQRSGVSCNGLDYLSNVTLNCTALNNDGSQSDYFWGNHTNEPLNHWDFYNADTNPNGIWHANDNNYPTLFTFTTPPLITGVDPSSGSPAGGSSVDISGRSFDVNDVSFGTTSAVIGDSGSTDVAVTSPTHAAGTVNLVLTNNDGQVATAISGFTYSAPAAPTISSGEATNITRDSAQLGGSITATGGQDATEHGFILSTHEDLSDPVQTTTLGSYSGTGNFTQVVTLTCGTTYYYSAYATNGGGQSTNDIKSFSTFGCVGWNMIDDTFQSGIATWTDVHQGIWSLNEDGYLQGNSNDSGGFMSNFFLRPTSEAAVNQRISVILNPNSAYDNEHIGAVLRYQDSNNFYLAHVSNTLLVIYRITNGSLNGGPIATASFSDINETGHTYKLEFSAVGNSPTVLIAQLIDVTDPENPAVVAGVTYSDGSEESIPLQPAGRSGVTLWHGGGDVTYAIAREIDYSLPASVTGLTNDSTTTKSKTWTWDSDDANATFRYSIDQDINGTPEGSYDSTKTATQDSGTGTYYIHVQAKDEAGNESEVVTVSAILDNTGPTVTVNSGSINQGASTSEHVLPFVATFSEAVSGFTADDVTATNAAISNFRSITDDNKTWAFNVILSAAGTVTIDVPAGKAEDLVGNENTASEFSFTYSPLVLGGRPHVGGVGTGGSVAIANASLHSSPPTDTKPDSTSNNPDVFITQKDFSLKTPGDKDSKFSQPTLIINDNTKASIFIPADTSVTVDGKPYVGKIAVPKILPSTNLPKPLPDGLDYVNAIIIDSKQLITFDKSITITLPIPPGTDLKTLKIYYYNEKSGKYELVGDGGQISKDKKFISVQTYHLSTYVAVSKGLTKALNSHQPEEPFTDVATSYWAHDFIIQLYELKAIEGREPHKFVPEGTLTRAEAVKIGLLAFRYKLDVSQDASGFSDLKPNAWYVPYIREAKKEAFISGKKFRPNDPITREEAMVMFLKMAKKLGPAKKSPFKDVPQKSASAIYINYAFAQAVIEGRAPGLFEPKGSITRAEIAKIIIKIKNL